MAVRPVLALFAAALLVWGAPALAVSDEERVAVYKEFRAQYDAKNYTAALPLAERLIAMTEAQYGSEDLKLSNPLTNLGTIQYKLGNFPLAIENYQRSLRILQAKSTLADRSQIRPLHGLGISFLANKDPESAVVALKRAIDLSRNIDGLFNIAQIEYLDPLIDAYAQTGRNIEAEKEAGYALRVEEAAHGRSSLKLLGRLDKLARWYETAGRYTTERSVHERALSILTKNAPKNDPRRVAPLRGIARSYRLEFTYGLEGGEGGPLFNPTGANGAPVIGEGSAQRRGEVALANALEVIDSNSPPDLKLRGETLADLGDWFLISNSSRRAFETYADAWKALSEAGATKLLEQPRILAYRPSISSIDRSQLDPSQAIMKTVELHFRVERDGRVENVTSPTTDVPENVVKSSIAALRRSRFAPRIENGVAVPTDGAVYFENVLIRIQPAQ